MANFIAMALARDVHLPRLRGADAPPRGRALEGVRVYASDQTHFSIGRALDELGFPPDTLASCRRTTTSGCAAPRGRGIARDRAAGSLPLAIAAVAGSTNTGSVDAIGELADVAEREGLWLHIDAAYGAAARLSRGTRPGAGPGARRLRDGRSAQVALPGVRHRRPDGSRRLDAGTGVRRATAGVLPRRARAREWERHRSVWR
jgi:hypothetical protein